MSASSDIDESSFFIAVHIGCGYYSPKKEREDAYRNLMKEACQSAAIVLKRGGSSLDAVTEAISVLENSPLTNAGHGSNLTTKGEVECDASIMEGTVGGEGKGGAFGACGAVKHVKNPIQLAATILKEEKKGRLPLQRVRPIFLVGEGATSWAQEHNLPTCCTLQNNNNKRCSLLSDKALREWESNMNKIAKHTKYYEEKPAKKLKTDSLHKKQDTVGAVCIDSVGTVAAGVSSGGIAVKSPGRVGEAAMYGTGCWAQNAEEKDGTPAVGVSCSGTGEQIMKSLLGSQCAKGFTSQDDAIDSMKELLHSGFLDPHKREKRDGGLLAVRTFDTRNDVEVLWGHTTPGFGLAYMASNMKQAKKAFISRLSNEQESGFTAEIGAEFIRFHDSPEK